MVVNGQLLAPAALHKERALSSHWIGGWVGPRAGLEAMVKRKIPIPCRELEHLTIQPLAQRYTTELSFILGNRYKL
jgi:hypothetical protein